MKRYYDPQNDRLVYIGCKADSEMWDDRWQQEDLEKLFAPRKLAGTDETVLKVTGKYLPSGARLLEGGCGLGMNVHLLGSHGYQVIGIDYAEKTIEKMKTLMPALDLRYGNLEHLEFEDGYFDGYWSFGVIEHFYHGYQKIAREMFRVIKPGGYLFVTVPALSRLRRFKAALGLFPRFREEATDLGAFYQFALSSEQVATDLAGYGFELVEQKGWSVYKGVSDEIPGSRIVMSLLCRLMETTAEHLLGKLCNHMHLMVFRKKPVPAPLTGEV